MDDVMTYDTMIKKRVIIWRREETSQIVVREVMVV
jgi:hypothetical protein